jgi:hypothetical protein
MASCEAIAAMGEPQNNAEEMPISVFACRALNSRFHRFISRLGRNKFSVRRRRELGHKGLILAQIFGSDRVRYPRNRKNSGYFPGSREFAHAEARPLGHSGDIH